MLSHLSTKFIAPEKGRFRLYASDGSGIPNFVLESPIYGGLSFAPTVPISTHRTYAVDWSDFLSPSDNPNLTAVTLRSGWDCGF